MSFPWDLLAVEVTDAQIRSGYYFEWAAGGHHPADSRPDPSSSDRSRGSPTCATHLGFLVAAAKRSGYSSSVMLTSGPATPPLRRRDVDERALLQYGDDLLNVAVPGAAVEAAHGGLFGAVRTGAPQAETSKSNAESWPETPISPAGPGPADSCQDRGHRAAPTSRHQRRRGLPCVSKGPREAVPVLPIALAAPDLQPKTGLTALVVDEPRVARADVDHVRPRRIPPDRDVHLEVQVTSHLSSYRLVRARSIANAPTGYYALATRNQELCAASARDGGRDLDQSIIIMPESSLSRVRAAFAPISRIEAGDAMSRPGRLLGSRGYLPCLPDLVWPGWPGWPGRDFGE